MDLLLVKQNIVFFLFILFWGLALLLPQHAAGASASVTRPLSFGIIDLHPAGDTITIAAAGGGDVRPSASANSVVTGGINGVIIVTSMAIEHVDISYPAFVTMSSGTHNIQIVEIADNSQYSVGGVDTPGGGISLLISVGGKIKIPAGQANGSYSASISILLNYS